MTTPEHPATPALTRKQIRELRNTGSTPVITATPSTGDMPVPETADTSSSPATPIDSTPPAVSVKPDPPLPKPATPAVVPPAPVADSSVDLGVSPLTRRQARQQERIRTASVPVITPEVIAAHAAATSNAAPSFAFPAAPSTEPATEPERSIFARPEDDTAVTTDSGMHALFGIPRTAPEPEAPIADEAIIEEAAGETSPWSAAVASAPATAFEAPVFDDPARDDADALAPVAAEDAASVREMFGRSTESEAEESKARVSPLLGAGLLDAPAPAEPVAADLPPSFDQLLSRSTGSTATPNALIVSQAPEVSALVAPVTATGEVLVTGTFNLPEGLGSTGHAKGTADGKEVDATLVDGELPSHSSPTPIAASAAVSTVKMPGEVIKPPAPEKGSRLMMTLAITAGALAFALAGVLILAFATGAL